MKCIIILGLVAAAYAVPVTYGVSERRVTVNPDGSILINVDNGEKVIQIRKDVGLNGQKKVDVSISGINIPSKRFQIDDEADPVGFNSVSAYDVSAEDYTREKRASTKSTTTTKTKSQVDVLNEILKDFQGPLDELTFQKLMKKITKSYQKGEISEPIYVIFQSLDKDSFKEFLDERELFQPKEVPTTQPGYPQYQQGIQGFPQEVQGFPQGYPQGVQGYPQVIPGYPQGIQGYPQVFPQYLQGIQRYPQGIQGYPYGIQGYPQGIQGYTQGIQGYPQYQGVQPGLARVSLQGPQVLPFSQTGPGSVYGLLGASTTTQTPDAINKAILARQLAQQIYGQTTTPRDYLTNYYNPVQTRIPVSYQQQIPTGFVQGQVPVGAYRQNVGFENLYY